MPQQTSWRTTHLRSPSFASRDREYGARTKFLDVRLATLRERERDRVLQLKPCPTKEMRADILTKPLPKGEHDYLTNLIMNGECQKLAAPDKGE